MYNIIMRYLFSSPQCKSSHKPPPRSTTLCTPLGTVKNLRWTNQTSARRARANIRTCRAVRLRRYRYSNIGWTKRATYRDCVLPSRSEECQWTRSPRTGSQAVIEIYARPHEANYVSSVRSLYCFTFVFLFVFNNLYDVVVVVPFCFAL